MANLAATTKLVGGITAILVCVSCILTLINGGFHIWWTRIINLMILSCIVACAEFDVSFVKRWFHVLSYFWGKALFYLFLGTVLFYDGKKNNFNTWFQFLTSIILIVVSIIYFILEFTTK